MADRRLIGPDAASTPVDTGAGSRPPRELPEDLLREASDRLAIMALLGAGLWATGTITYHFVIRAMTGDATWASPQLMDLVALVCIVTSFLLYWYLRRSDRDPRFVLDLGLAYLLVGALGIGTVWHLTPVPVDWVIQPTITWVGPMMLIMAAIVPNTPGKTAVAGLIAASMNPIGMLIARARGTWQFESLGDIVLMHYPDYMIVGAAVVVASVMTRLGQQVAKARELGSYHLGELLGRGGTGEVYRATHRMLARPAAIKLIRPETIGGGKEDGGALAIKRFRREAEVAASLRSPNTVALYDFGVTRDGALYIVMELLEGMTLDKLVRDHGPVPLNRAIHLLRQACASLEEAHVAGLVHRDIKPANIHVGRLGLQHDVVKVLDFGLVKSVAHADGEPSLETATGLMPGTPAFMAPELALGERYDGRADLYALGCVGYQLVTGRPVFDGDLPIHILAKHLHAPPPPLSERTANPIDPEFERLILACLAKRPDDRPASAAALAAQLGAIAVDPWTEADARAWWRTHGPRA